MPIRTPATAFMMILFASALPLRGMAAQDAFLHDARAVAVGPAHSCAILTDEGNVECWGDNEWGQLGNDAVARSSIPVPVRILASREPLTGATAIAAGTDFTCALQGTTGRVYCWGRNLFGQLGAGIKDYVPHPAAIPVNMPNTDGTADEGVLEIAASPAGYHVCALLDDGANTVRCWGANYSGQLGDGTKRDSATPVEAVAPALGGGYVRLEHGKHISAGGAHSCAILDSTELYPVCWGENRSGQLSTGTMVDSVAAGAVLITPARGTPYPLVDVAQISTGGDHTCVLLDGTLLGECWGSNAYGQIGNPYAGAATATPYGIAASFIQISAGYAHTCGILSDNHVSCWGLNDDGQLGDGFTDTARTPLTLSIEGAMVAAGVSHTCAVMLDATIRCWGKNDLGQLGTGNEVNSHSPVHVLRFNDRIFADDYELRSDGL